MVRNHLMCTDLELIEVLHKEPVKSDIMINNQKGTKSYIHIQLLPQQNRIINTF